METSLSEDGAFSAITGGTDAVPSSGVIVNFPGFQPDQVNHKHIMHGFQCSSYRSCRPTGHTHL